MSKMKAKGLILFIFTITELVIAQEVSKDYFPLAVGNVWTYKYYDSDYEAPGDWTYTTYGDAKYRIMSKLSSPDSNVWKFKETRNLTQIYYVYGNNNRDTTSVVDTSYFDLIEYNNGNHLLKILSRYIYPFSFLCKPFSDSLQLSRFAPDSLKDTITVGGIWINGLWNVIAQFRRDVGLINLSYSNHFPIGHSDYAFDSLMSFTVLSVPERKYYYHPENIVLQQNYPNPFNPSTTISVTTFVKSELSVKIYDVLGRQVQVLFDEPILAGDHKLIWNASNYPSGIYYCVVRSNYAVKSIKAILVK